jgi:hypothetical protein
VPESSFVSLKATLAALETQAGESAKGALRFIVRGCADEHIRYRHRDTRPPPADFWHGETHKADGSDLIQICCVSEGGYAYTLHGVSVAWADVVAAYPELRDTPPRSGVTAVEVSLAVPLMTKLEGLATWLWSQLRPSPEPAIDLGGSRGIWDWPALIEQLKTLRAPFLSREEAHDYYRDNVQRLDLTDRGDGPDPATVRRAVAKYGLDRYVAFRRA